MKTRAVTGEGFQDYYVQQLGHGMPVYTGAVMQKGHGIGNVLKGLFRIATPLIKSIGKTALKRAKPVMREVGTWALNKGIDAIAGKVSKPKRRRTVNIPRAQRRPASRRVPQRRVVSRKQLPRDIFSQ